MNHPTSPTSTHNVTNTTPQGHQHQPPYPRHHTPTSSVASGAQYFGQAPFGTIPGRTLPWAQLSGSAPAPPPLPLCRRRPVALPSNLRRRRLLRASYPAPLLTPLYNPLPLQTRRAKPCAGTGARCVYGDSPVHTCPGTEAQHWCGRAFNFGGGGSLQPLLEKKKRKKG